MTTSGNLLNVTFEQLAKKIYTTVQNIQIGRHILKKLIHWLKLKERPRKQKEGKTLLYSSQINNLDFK